ncbi:MAG TPA: diguanylate cyclase, partial [Pseudonocardiaceae bacterium]
MTTLQPDIAPDGGQHPAPQPHHAASPHILAGPPSPMIAGPPAPRAHHPSEARPSTAPAPSTTPGAAPVRAAAGAHPAGTALLAVRAGGAAEGLAAVHESAATLLAASGQWRQAYEHLWAALELLRAERADPVLVPEQLRREVDRLRQEHAEAREQSLRDSLTDAYNRRYLDQRLVDLLNDQPSAGSGVALIDLDWFKQVNDTYGHGLGDRVLQQVAELLRAELPDGAFCARYGGEEFALVMPGLAEHAALAVCEAARARVERHPWHELRPGLRVTVSAGVARADGEGTEQQLRRADLLLYAAKQSGRNAVAYFGHGTVRL